MKRLFIDDERTPITNYDWDIVRSYDEAMNYIQVNGCPGYISFDHDLGDESKTGFAIAKEIVELDLDHNGKFIPEDFQFNVHSANPTGRKNIEQLILNYLSFRNS